MSGGFPAPRRFCGAAVFSCKGAAPAAVYCAGSRGAYHVADIDICDCFNSSFLCAAGRSFSDLREADSLRSKVSASRKYTKG